MKALNKGKAGDLFKKIQKKQDIEQITNQIEARMMAPLIGISEQEINQFSWFFDQLSKFKLPPQFQRVLNQQKNKVTYINKITGKQSNVHPVINLIKSFFYEGHKSNRSAFTFQNKKEKLLPYVEDKMMKNCMSLNSKRKQVDKLNLQKDQNGKIVLSKLAKIKPNTKSLISARSYMLKMLVEKVFTRKQLIGKTKKAKVFTAILNQKDKYQNDEQQQKIFPENLQTYQQIFIETSKFYNDEYGNIRNIPQIIRESPDYRLQTPEDLIKDMIALNIRPEQIEYYWFSSLMNCLSLPPNWAKQKATNLFPSYVYEPLKLNFNIHPSYIYIIEQMNNFQAYFDALNNQQKAEYYKDRKMTFLDYFQRNYTVDIYGLALKSQYKNKSSKKDKQISLQLEQKANDWMVVEAVRNSDIPPMAYPVLESVCNFWRESDFEGDEWIPSVSPFGDITWSSTVNYSSIDYCPYVEQLKILIQNKSKELNKIQKQDLKKVISFQMDEDQIRANTVEGSQGDVLMNKLTVERQSFIRHYLSQPVNKPNIIPYSVKDMEGDRFYDSLFISPFELQLDLKINNQYQEVPLWLQKVRAKKFENRINNLLNFTNDFTAVKEIMIEYALDSVGKNEPHRIQQMQNKIRNVDDVKRMKEFLVQITDIDAREDRKNRINNIKTQPENDENFFGSEVSNVDLEQVQMIQSQQQNNSDSDSHSKQSSESLQASNFSDSQSEQLLTEHTKQEKIENIYEQNIIITQNRSQKSFLINQEKYEQSKYLDNLDEGRLNKIFNRKIKDSLQQNKYSNQLTRNNLYKNIQLHAQSAQYLINIKKNLILTNFKYSTVPYKDGGFMKISKKQPENNKNQKKYYQNISDIKPSNRYLDFQQFHSQIQQYPNQDILKQIETKNQKQFKSVKVQDVEEYNPEIIYKQQQQKQIVLTPIKRVKPDLLKDPLFKHINTVDSESQLTIFKTTFLKKGDNQLPHFKKSISKNKSTSSLVKNKSTLSLVRNPQTQEKNHLSVHKDLRSTNFFTTITKSKTKSFMGPESLKNLSHKQLFNNHKFNRVCLGNTAANFLVSEPLRRKSQIFVIEARKTLLHKGRGLDNYISKNY